MRTAACIALELGRRGAERTFAIADRIIAELLGVLVQMEARR